MWRKTLLSALTFALVAAVAGAQARSAAPKVPVAPVTPVIAPDIQTELEALGVALDAPAFALAADAAALSALQDRVLVNAQKLTFVSDFDYDRGISSLDSGRYDSAVEAFDKVISANGKKVEGAMYWKAYALSRLGRRDEAIRTLEELQKKFPSSRWTNDAKALLVDVRQASGQPVSADVAGDQELKLIALNGLMMRDPDTAIPMVEKLLTGSASPKLKERGLFVLAQSASPRAKTLLAEVAKGKGNPDLQLKALDYLGAFGSGPDVPLLVDVYRSTGDVDVKKRVIRSLGMSGRRGVVFGGYMAMDYPDAATNLAIAQAYDELERSKVDIERARAQAETERVRMQTDAERQRAVVAGRATGQGSASYVTTAPSAASAERQKAREAKAKEAADALWQLYSTESSLELKREILSNMRHSSQADRLMQIARTDGNADLRRAAVQGLAFERSPKTAEVMLGLYKDEKDPAVKRQVLDNLMTTSSAATLVQIARQEKDPALRKRIVERLSTMKDKEAVDYMVEILKK
jgi:tetratricopeptide (TPR) repeat protein